MTPTLEKEPRDKDIGDRSPFVSRGRLPDPFALVMFGATGDLAARKLFPAVFALARGQFLPALTRPGSPFLVVGVGRRGKDASVFREDVRRSSFAPEELDGLPADWLRARPVGAKPSSSSCAASRPTRLSS